MSTAVANEQMVSPAVKTTSQPSRKYFSFCQFFIGNRMPTYSSKEQISKWWTANPDERINFSRTLVEHPELLTDALTVLVKEVLKDSSVQYPRAVFRSRMSRAVIRPFAKFGVSTLKLTQIYRRAIAVFNSNCPEDMKFASDEPTFDEVEREVKKHPGLTRKYPEANIVLRTNGGKRVHPREPQS
jgi:hypothetical protein